MTRSVLKRYTFDSKSEGNMIENLSHIIEKLERILGAENITVDEEAIEKEIENTLDIKRSVYGIVYPSTIQDVSQIVKLANTHLIPLYPISKGRNIGYGEKIPVSDGHLIIDLHKMNSIRHFDDVLGYVKLEPGVTQKQLYEYLQDKNAPFWMDATGAGLESSIIGNSLEGGFGHTPKGYRRHSVSDYEVVLGNGTILQTGSFPGMGPDLSGLFIQSNFGIITAAKLELMPVPERFESFFVTVENDSGLESFIEIIREMRQNDIMNSLVHVGNATRYLMTAGKLPAEYSNTLISCDTAQKIMSSPSLKVGYWNAIGGIYGTINQTKARKKEIRKALQNIGVVTFFNDAKINSISKLTGSWLLKNSKYCKQVKKSIESYKSVHGLMKGIPSDEPLKNIHWRVNNYNNMGLLWFSPTVSANGSEVRNVIAKAENLFAKFEFEMAVTVTFAKPSHVVCVFNINFDKTREDEKKRAYELYHELVRQFSEDGIQTYRRAIIGMKDLTYNDKGKNETFQSLKKSLDPMNIIAPGKYGV